MLGKLVWGCGTLHPNRVDMAATGDSKELSAPVESNEQKATVAAQPEAETSAKKVGPVMGSSTVMHALCLHIKSSEPQCEPCAVRNPSRNR